LWQHTAETDNFLAKAGHSSAGCRTAKKNELAQIPARARLYLRFVSLVTAPWNHPVHRQGRRSSPSRLGSWV